LLAKLLPTQEKSYAPQQAYLEGKDGKAIPATFKDGKYYYANTENLIPPDEMKGKAYRVIAEQNADGSWDYKSGANAKLVNTGSTAPESPAIVNNKPLKTNINQLQKGEVERLEKLKEDFNSNPAIKSVIAKQSELEATLAVVKIGNWVGDAALLSNAAKGMGRDVGNLSVDEQERYRFSPELVANVRSRWSRWTTGVIPEEDRELFKEALRVMREKNDDLLNKQRDKYGRIATHRVKDIDPEFAKNYIYDTESLSDDKPNKDNEILDQIFK
jgi:hypothetical protein